MASNAPIQTPATTLTNDIREIKEPVPIPDALDGILWALAALAFAGLCWWAWRRWKRRIPAVASEPPVPAHERARQRLREALRLLQEPHPFSFAVSDAIRQYLEERFHLHAPERTTEEFLSELHASSALTFDQKATLGEFLQRCDLVKFARYEPTEDELRELYESAMRLVDETEPAFVTGQMELETGEKSETQRRSDE